MRLPPASVPRDALQNYPEDLLAFSRECNVIWVILQCILGTEAGGSRARIDRASLDDGGTEGNVEAQTPPVDEGNSPEHGVEEEVEDFSMCSSPNPPLTR
ncbi:unnamed protein product [Ranitomeya imitator]|uniref:Uncharacterized protein n=1 Tax=Ranitomeya imitator TaxID=111125 RepID=A0ABN9MHH3_9NEOB|nr:unnamed protein product [Ranitomeya imitator]